MTPKLSDDLRRAIQERGGAPVHLVDPLTNERYVILPEALYDRVKPIFEHEGDLDPREAYPFVDEAMRDDDAHDPTLDSYQAFPRPQP